MRNIKPAIIAAIIAIATPLAGLAGWFSSEPDGAIRIGINAPLTGPIAAWSGQFPNGFKMGIEDASRAQGIDPALFSVDVQDNAGKPSDAVSIFNKQAINGFDAYISVATGPANANAPALDAMEKPHFIASFDPLITKAAPNRLRVMANSKIEAPLFIDYARRRQAKSVFVIQINMAYAEEQWSTIVIPALEKDGIKVTREHFELTQRDFKTITQKAKVANADLIYIVGYSFHVQPALQALRNAGLIKDGRVISVMDFVDLVYTGTLTEELRDVVFVAPIFDIPGKIEKARDWRKRYKEKFNMSPTYVPAYAYDNATMIVNAYAKSGKVTTETLTGVTPFDGINGQIELDQDRDIVATVTLAEIDKEGEIRELTDADFAPLQRDN
uniref:ABC-type branched-chain amino acid transport system, substrate-binding protein n=1 Tax=Candidatus Kentrum eta TaxID=2126337 RepID=A0A450U6J8_9GAMM|nr:MAG: ABC-type branched-chain amino acid transport system, substrate-binding protein [Candidatus Kentron sp. H]VFJ88874.1 MAG: ABC-type branched-chain amino acid transport system, substrate-binding protein [Candidatus Kentron sp. H]VFJ95118.1 MAG: ABC-type branched-chain amino acid transport system, substrate-binding protein [Candidatus Kentron sp. H]